VLIVADRTADPEFAAADMLAQRSTIRSRRRLCHPGCRARRRWPLPSIDSSRCSPARDRHARARRLRAILIVRSLDEAIAIANRLAPSTWSWRCANPRTG